MQFFKDVKIDWLANRRMFIAVSILLMLAGSPQLFSSMEHPDGSEAFNLGVDFKGGTVLQPDSNSGRRLKPSATRSLKPDVHDAVIQPVTDKPDIALIKIPLRRRRRVAVPG
jgi:preprotein translocase subunit SecF